MSFTNAQLAQKMADLIDYWSSFNTEYANWLGGSVGGGTNLDGTYPLTDWTGNTALVKCPAQLQDDVDNITSGATAQANAAAASAAAAAADASTASTQAGLADAARIAAELAETNAETAEASAVNASVTSTTQANLATDRAGYAQEWAEKATAVSVAAGGDGSTTFSAKYWAEVAEAFSGSIDTNLYAQLAQPEIITGSWDFQAAVNVLGTAGITIGPFEISSSFMGSSNAGRSRLLPEASTATNPNIIPRGNDLDTGIGWNADDSLSLVAGGVEGIRITEAGSFISIDLNGDTTLAGSAFFTPIAAPVHTEGRMFYDSAVKAITYYNEEADVSVNVGQETVVRVWNATGATISNGSAVYINGSQGANLPTVALAKADAETTSQLLGLATHDIEANSAGYITVSGAVNGLDTSGFTAGDDLYLSDTTAGVVTNVAPTGDSYLIPVGYCTVSNVAVGQIKVVLGTYTPKAVLKDITAAKVSNWDTAYGWGDHALAGYAGTVAEEFTSSVAATPAIKATNSGTSNVIAEFVGDSDSLQIKCIAAGDYSIVNPQQNNAINIYDGTGGVSIDYNGNSNFVFDANGLKVNGSAANPGAGLGSLSSSYLYLDGKEVIKGDTTWLRLNENGDFSSGIYMLSRIAFNGQMQRYNKGAYLYHASSSYAASGVGAVTFSTASPSGGSSGDIWYKYT